MHCTAIFGKARQAGSSIHKLLTFFTELLTEFIRVMFLDLQYNYDVMPWEPNAQTGVCYQLELGKHLADVSAKTLASYFSEQKLHLTHDQ